MAQSKELNVLDEGKIWVVMIIAFILLALIVDKQISKNHLKQSYATTRNEK